MMKTEVLSFQFPPFPAFISCGKSRFDPGECHVTRAFPVCVLMVITRGIVHFTEGNTAFTLCAGEYFIQTPEVLHFGHKPDASPAEYYWFHFIPSGPWRIAPSSPAAPLMVSDAGDGLRQPLMTLSLPMHRQIQTDPLIPAMEALVRDFNVVIDPVACQAAFDSLLYRLASPPPGRIPAARQSLAEDVRSYIHRHYACPVNLRHIAAEFHFSPDHISRCFSQMYHQTVHSYLTRLRVNHAQYLLRTTNLTVEQVAAALGYEDLSVFSRMFRKSTGLSPTGYRRDTAPLP